MNKSSLHGEYAGFITRGTAFITDLVIISLVLIGVNWFFSAMLSQLLPIDIRACAESADITILLYSCKIIRGSLIAFNIFFGIVYTIFFWILAGQTPGKYLFGLRVVRLNGHGMNLVICLIRYFSYALCILSLGLGFFNVLINDRRQGWHDILARTCVVYTWEARQNDALLARVRHRLDRDRSSAS